MEPHPLLTFRRTRAQLDRDSVASFADTLRKRVALGREFHALITGDRELRSLNQRFRGADYPTDVLSFPSGGDYLGDIAISLGRARSQARSFGHSLEDELRTLMLHGVLHLLGYDHESDSGEMRRLESTWRRKLGLPSALIERAGR